MTHETNKKRHAETHAVHLNSMQTFLIFRRITAAGLGTIHLRKRTDAVAAASQDPFLHRS